LSHDTHIDRYDWLGFSLRSLVLIFIGIVGLGFYIGVLLFGENSILALNRLEREKQRLEQTERKLKVQNQKLQKEYFEILQLTE
jgi:hypothetical protein